MMPTNAMPPIIYGLLLTLGFLLFTFVSLYEWKKKGFSTYKFWLLMMFVGVFSIYGAKWWHVIFHPSDYSGFVSSFLNPAGGRSILGSIVFGLVTTWIFTRIWIPEIEWRRSLSILLPNIFLGQVIGRWGNFTNQEIYGGVVNNLDWLPSWIADHMYIIVKDIDTGTIISSGYRQPLFLYESIANLFAWTLITFWMKRDKRFKAGTHGAAYLLSYGTIRSSMELFRDDQFIMKWNEIPTSFILSIMVAIVGLMLFIYYQYIFNEKIAVYWQFKYPFKIEQLKNNMKAISLLITFQLEGTIKDKFKSNKVRYNKNINKINTTDVVNFIKEISKEY